MIELPNDGTLGDTLAGFRQVHVRVTGNPQSWGFFGTIFDAVKGTLEDANWLVDSVTASGSGVGCTNWGCTLDIFVEVNNIYSQADIEQNIVRDLSGTFGVTGISVISGGNPPVSNGGGYNGGYNNGGYGGYVYNAGDLGTVTVHTGDNTGASGLPSAPAGASNGDYLKKFAEGLGMTTPMVVAGGVLVALVLLKR